MSLGELTEFAPDAAEFTPKQVFCRVNVEAVFRNVNSYELTYEFDNRAYDCLIGQNLRTNNLLTNTKERIIE